MREIEREREKGDQRGNCGSDWCARSQEGGSYRVTVSLTRTEYVLLETLVRRAGTVVPREVLIEEGWGLGADVSDANLYFFVRALRAKITAPGEEELLQTVRGVGYSIRSADCC